MQNIVQMSKILSPEWRESRSPDWHRKNNRSWLVEQLWSSFFPNSLVLAHNSCVRLRTVLVTIAMQCGFSLPSNRVNALHRRKLMGGWSDWLQEQTFSKDDNPDKLLTCLGEDYFISVQSKNSDIQPHNFTDMDFLDPNLPSGIDRVDLLLNKIGPGVLFEPISLDSSLLFYTFSFWNIRLTFFFFSGGRNHFRFTQ